MGSISRIYQQLKERFREESIEISYSKDRGRGNNGTFTPPRSVEIFQPDPLDEIYEIITLSHEYGHFRSYDMEPAEWQQYLLIKGGCENAIGFAVVMAEAQKNDVQEAICRANAEYSQKYPGSFQRVIDEEIRAWDIGRQLLTNLGGFEWDAFERRRKNGLYVHRCRLGMETWVGDGDVFEATHE
jgi:hypothetical protein